MILIKDRHQNGIICISAPDPGKYDTYKGSTHNIKYCRRTPNLFGKYDTYKGSTRHSQNFHQKVLGGNMILIKDRHL